MKVAILAGGQGTRLGEETEARPKPMVEIGGKPILWHIMRHFDHHGFNEFVVALGYKGDHIRRYFAEYHSSGRSMSESWTVDLVETGPLTNTGGRIKRLSPYLKGETFLLAWGDDLSDLDISHMVEFHRSHGKLVTVAAVHPPPRFGQLILDDAKVVEFSEKPLDPGWINGGFFVCEPEVIDYIEGDQTQWEREPMETLAAKGEMMAYRHEGFWLPMDTLRDKTRLQALWDSGSPPWRVWDSNPSD
jgi:glucose-1-phosphate cytidylyltransferase